MEARSSTCKRSKGEAVIFLWSVLLLIGIICALINAAYVDLLAFPQLHFCPPDMDDPMTLTNSGSNITGADWLKWGDIPITGTLPYKKLSRIVPFPIPSCQILVCIPVLQLSGRSETQPRPWPSAGM